MAAAVQAGPQLNRQHIHRYAAQHFSRERRVDDLIRVYREVVELHRPASETA